MEKLTLESFEKVHAEQRKKHLFHMFDTNPKWLERKNELEEVIHNEARLKTHIKAKEYVDFQQEVFQILNPHNALQPYCLITINPREGVEYDVLDAAVENMADWMVWSVRTYELSKTGRLHCHMLGEIKPQRQNKSFYRIKGFAISSTMCENAKHVDIQYVPKSELVKTYSYITKAAVGKSKQEAHLLTLQWREENSIPAVFTRGDIPTCLSPHSPVAPLELINLN